MKSGSWRKYSVVVLKKSQMIERQIWQICPGEIPHYFLRCWELRRKPKWAKVFWGSNSEIQGKLFYFSGIDVNGRKRVWVIWVSGRVNGNAEFKPRFCRWLQTGKGCRVWRILIRSQGKGILKQNNEWKTELSSVTWSKFTAVFLRWIGRAASLESPTLVKLYTERKPFTVQPIKRP